MVNQVLGKTKFVEGILSFFNLENEISSPTFTIVNEYSNNITNELNINLFHFDVYRLEDSSQFLEIGGEEYFNNGICIIEWGDLIKDILPKEYIQIDFEKDLNNNEDTRILNITTYGDRFLTYFKDFKNSTN